MTKIFSNVKRFTSLFIILFLVFTAFESYGQRYGGLGPGYYRNYYMKRSSGPAKGGSVKSYSEIKQEEQSGQTAAEEPQSQKKSNAEDIEWSESVDPEDEDFIWEEPPTATGGAVAEGTTLSASAFKALDCDAKTVTANGSTYYRCGSTWYSRVFKGEDVVYIAVAAPSGY